MKNNWSDKDLERLMVFCLLDRAMPYEKVCKVFDYLDNMGLTTKENLRDIEERELADALKMSGHRFPNQTAKHLKGFSESEVSLRTGSRDELIQHIPGLGMKLASMFLRNTRGEPYAVLDVHVKRWLKEQGFKGGSYKKLEQDFLSKCRELGKTPYQLDMEIWQQRRIGNRRRNK